MNRTDGVSGTACDLRWDFDGRLPVIVGGGRAEPSSEEIGRAEELIGPHGLVLFRGFDLSLDGLRALTRRLGCAFASEKWAPHAFAAQAPRIYFHTEQAHVRAVPASLWFYMARPAERGGETLLCDGAAVYSSLSASARAFLEDHDVLYWWRYTAEPPGGKPLRYPTDPPGLGREFRQGETTRDGGYYHSTTLCRSLIYSRTGRRVFGNHILNTVSRGQDSGPPEPDGFHQARMPSREPLPRELVAELLSVTSELTVPCQLEAKDAIWVDNTRFLHGRASYEGSRHLLVRKAFHADQWMPGVEPGEYADTLAPPSPTRRAGRTGAHLDL